MAAYPGFPAEGVEFLRELAANNDRDWFQARRDVYERFVKEPMIGLVEAVGQALERSAPHYLTDPRKTIYRIHRDTRFSKNKQPYKAHVAAFFPHRALRDCAAAGFYFHISPEESLAAGGVYMPGSAELLAIRRRISDDLDGYRAAIGSPAFRRYCGEVTGERLSRPPKGFAADDPAVEVLKQKQFLATAPLDPATVSTPKLPREIVKRLEAMVPFVDYLNAPLLRGGAGLSTMGSFP